MTMGIGSNGQYRTPFFSLLVSLLSAYLSYLKKGLVIRILAVYGWVQKDPVSVQGLGGVRAIRSQRG